MMAEALKWLVSTDGGDKGAAVRAHTAPLIEHVAARAGELGLNVPLPATRSPHMIGCRFDDGCVMPLRARARACVCVCVCARACVCGGGGASVHLSFIHLF
jgi:hypothetical protein